MKTTQILIASLFVLPLAMQAQEVSVTLTPEQYKKVEQDVLKNSREARVHSDWAQFGRYAEANARLKERPVVVFMGNSITDNWYRMRTDFFESHHFAGRGISGQTSSEMLVRFRQDVINLHPKTVIINAGINDIAHNNGVILLENVMGNIQSMCELAKANHIRPILTSTLPANRIGWRPDIVPTESVISLNSMIQAYAHRAGLTYIDYYAAMVDDQKGLPKNLSSDGVHPLPAGYEIMEALVLKTLKMK